jgi:hypothetical protein
VPGTVRPDVAPARSLRRSSSIDRDAFVSSSFRSLTRTRASFPTRPDASIPPASRRRAPEEIENSREETEEDPKGGLFGGGWSTSREWSSETRGGGAGGPTPELPFPFSLFFELDDDSSRPNAEEEARRRRGGGDAREDLLRKNLDELGEELARRGRRRGDPPPPPPRESGSRSFLGDREFRDRHDERTLLDYLLGTKPSKRSERQPSYDDAKRGSREA